MQSRRPPRRAVNGILLLDKPLGLSSSDALQRVRRLFNAEKAGHTGSLDPLATGMLPLCFGQATKLCGLLLDSNKRYQARVKLGERTATGDAEGEVIARSDPGGLTQAALLAALPQFLGEIWQVPPMYSALRHEGRRLYELARQGQEIERAPRKIQILDLQVTAFGDGFFEIDVHCSKGTYIRTLAEDLASAAGQCAHLAALRRTEVHPFGRGPLHRLEDLEQMAQDGGTAAVDVLLIGAGRALTDWPQFRVDPLQASALAQGRAIRVADAVPVGRVAVLDEAGSLLGIAECQPGGALAPRRWLAGSG